MYDASKRRSRRMNLLLMLSLHSTDSLVCVSPSTVMFLCWPSVNCVGEKRARDMYTCHTHTHSLSLSPSPPLSSLSSFLSCSASHKVTWSRWKHVTIWKRKAAMMMSIHKIRMIQTPPEVQNFFWKGIHPSCTIVRNIPYKLHYCLA